jgi:hypothetical protein
VKHFQPSLTFKAEAGGRVVHFKIRLWHFSKYRVRLKMLAGGQTLRLTGGNTERREGLVQSGNTKGGSITVPLTSCLTGLD